MKNNAMYYVAVEWIHTFPDEPIYLYYELDADRYEQRKVEEYRDGTLHSADATHGQGTTFLSWEQHPPLAEINADPEFHAREITAQEFNRIWSQAAPSGLQFASSQS